MSLLETYSTIRTLAYLPERSLDRIRKATGTADPTHILLNTIETEYQSAITDSRVYFKSNNTLVSDVNDANKICIVTNLKNIAGIRIVLLFVKNNRVDAQPWMLSNIISEDDYNDSFYIDLGTTPNNMLYNFAIWTEYRESLKELRDNCLKENWSFISNPTDEDYPILIKYITYTFAKLWTDKQVLKSKDGRYAAFNTGLVNKNYKYIYVLFENYAGPIPWKFSQFCMPGIGIGGRLLAENFPILPKPAKYFNNIADVSYILSPDKSPDEQMPELQPDHYFIDHPERLPLNFLQDGCRKDASILKLLKTDISGYGREQLTQYWERIGKAIAQNNEVYDDLESSFRNAVRKAVMRASWNYRTAIPVYFPTGNRMSILLPLSLGSSDEVDVALVVERNVVSETYSAPTILDLITAYSNARLVCKPESDWLNQEKFTMKSKPTIELE